MKLAFVGEWPLGCAVNHNWNFSLNFLYSLQILVSSSWYLGLHRGLWWCTSKQWNWEDGSSICWGCFCWFFFTSNGIGCSGTGWVHNYLIGLYISNSPLQKVLILWIRNLGLHATVMVYNGISKGHLDSWVSMKGAEGNKRFIFRRKPSENWWVE